MKIKREVVLLLSLITLMDRVALAGAEAKGRYFFEGDGVIHLASPKVSVHPLHYRLPDGNYSEQAWREANRIFGAPPDARVSLRLISLLDFLQDHFGAERIQVISGYRSAERNEQLRRRGKLAAKTSLHLEGMAADIEIPGVSSRHVWEFVKKLDCCGTGYYRSGSVHIDTGPSRFWDEKTAHVDRDLGARNHLILLRTDQDIYLAGETVHLMLVRITDYPIEIVPQLTIMKGNKKMEQVPLVEAAKKCITINNKKEARSLVWTIPTNLPTASQIKIRLDFCKQPFPEMPEAIESNLIDIVHTN